MKAIPEQFGAYFPKAADLERQWSGPELVP